jgi:hypothetical protein
MARGLAILVVLGGLVAFLVIQNQGADRAFGGALARFTKKDAPKSAAYDEPAPRRTQDWERSERVPPPSITQGVRDRVNRAMQTGAKRHGGS